MARPPAIRRITAATRERINRLADVLYPFLPLSSRSASAVTFRRIFRESRVESYLDGSENKMQALQEGFTELYRRHERLPRTVVRKIVPAAIEYRRFRRKPLTRAELDQLATCMSDLDLDMTAELAEVQLDETLPRITVPPEKLKERLRLHDLTPALASEPLQLFNDGHFNEAVRKAAERFEDRVRDLSELDAHGSSLMGKAFDEGDVLDINAWQPENQADFLRGYKLMSMGMMACIRNVFSHGDEERRAPEECFEMLLLINWLFRPLKED